MFHLASFFGIAQGKSRSSIACLNICILLSERKPENKADLLKEIGDLSGSVFTQIILSSIRRLSFTAKTSLKEIKRI